MLVMYLKFLIYVYTLFPIIDKSKSVFMKYLQGFLADLWECEIAVLLYIHII